MTDKQFAKELAELGFAYNRDSEYNRDVYFNDKFLLATNDLKVYSLRITIYIDYYTVRMVLYTDTKHKYCESFYVNRELSQQQTAVHFISTFVDNCVRTYGIDLELFAQ